jgi:hypothetical protein
MGTTDVRGVMGVFVGHVLVMDGLRRAGTWTGIGASYSLRMYR